MLGTCEGTEYLCFTSIQNRDISNQNCHSLFQVKKWFWSYWFKIYKPTMPRPNLGLMIPGTRGLHVVKTCVFQKEIPSLIQVSLNPKSHWRRIDEPPRLFLKNTDWRWFLRFSRMEIPCHSQKKTPPRHPNTLRFGVWGMLKRVPKYRTSRGGPGCLGDDQLKKKVAETCHDFPPHQKKMGKMDRPKNSEVPPKNLDRIYLGIIGPSGKKEGSSWWFQPIWKILVKLDHFPR